jgi:hypothetical protein
MRVHFVLAFCLTISSVSGQPSDPNGGKPPGSAPISGVEYLIGLGGLYGVKKILAKKRTTKK